MQFTKFISGRYGQILYTIQEDPPCIVCTVPRTKYDLLKGKEEFSVEENLGNKVQSSTATL